jgi:hypothetical protein
MFRPALCGLAILLAAATEPTAFEIRTGGDDGLTQRLADALRSAFATAPGFTADASSERLVVTIPTHVAWREVGGRTRVTYAVELALGAQSIRRTGSCWETDMSICARQIVDAASALHRP